MVSVVGKVGNEEHTRACGKLCGEGGRLALASWLLVIAARMFWWSTWQLSLMSSSYSSLLTVYIREARGADESARDEVYGQACTARLSGSARRTARDF